MDDIMEKPCVPQEIHDALVSFANDHFNQRHGPEHNRHVYSSRAYARLQRYLDIRRFRYCDGEYGKAIHVVYKHNYSCTFPFETQRDLESIAKGVVHNAERNAIEPIYKYVTSKQASEAIQQRAEILKKNTPKRPYLRMCKDTQEMVIFVDHALSRRLHLEAFRDDLEDYYEKKSERDTVKGALEMFVMTAGMAQAAL